ncbi:imidazole glycerol phosphate synthase subunit hisH [Caldanaerobius fijiensis DSM 17918]|uniref:Imidazole glycerol phosphate synthase subunit HisH n=1 Tax=Caldanaerobius fijiensis DSM 17918 TaxID=1121256 RepID=A0A1M5B732_9THEO|nr:imidazole glycerol phosphate synthase subunit HisH [Caldanaerobius fijiensis]SHF38323.1 imidazole glycerol phosphate synthase subunit hisH [Caldanaerobius fijiensis DSM 17918]
MIAIIDYGMGNLRSVQKAFEYTGHGAVITQDKSVIDESDGLVLPGVGAFPDAMKALEAIGLVDAIVKNVERGKPFLGICLGMQLLFETSYEGGLCRGLGLLRGEIVEIPKRYKVPHMGWNCLDIKQEVDLLKGVESGSYVYFVHSYYLKTDEVEQVYASVDYGVEIPAVVGHKNIYACQFHPEKSGEVGLQIIKNFGEMVK